MRKKKIFITQKRAKLFFQKISSEFFHVFSPSSSRFSNALHAVKTKKFFCTVSKSMRRIRKVSLSLFLNVRGRSTRIRRNIHQIQCELANKLARGVPKSCFNCDLLDLRQNLLNSVLTSSDGDLAECKTFSPPCSPLFAIAM